MIHRAFINGNIEHVAQQHRQTIARSTFAALEGHPVAASVTDAPLDERVDHQVLLLARLHEIGTGRVERQDALIEIYDILERCRQLEVQPRLGHDGFEFAECEQHGVFSFAYGVKARLRKARGHNNADGNGSNAFHLFFSSVGHLSADGCGSFHAVRYRWNRSPIQPNWCRQYWAPKCSQQLPNL